MHVRNFMLSGALLAVLAPLTAFGIQAEAAPKPCRRTCDTTAPVVSIAAPTAGSSVSGTVTVSGSSSDNQALSSVSVSVDGGAWSPASGTGYWTWQWPTSSVPNGTHKVTAKAVDASGNVKTTSLDVAVSNTTADTTAPSVGFSSPAAGSSVSGTVNVAGTAADNASVAKVEVKVDSGAWQTAAGTTSWSWSWATAGLAAGSHTLTARATDAAGNVTTSTLSVSLADASAPTISIATPASGATVSGTVSVTGSAADNAGVATVELSVDGGPWVNAAGTSNWSWSWATGGVPNGTHTLAARATDSAGNVSVASRTVTVSNSSIAPNTQGSWTSPEGVQINVDSAGSWTIAQIYSMLKANALDLGTVGPTLTINVQDNYSSQTQSSATNYGGSYTGYRATMWLDGDNSGFSQRPDDTLAHEYGHAWSMYWFYLVHQGSWTSYLQTRWASAGGATTLATDTRAGSTYSWQTGELIADDYRLLLASSTAISQRPTHLNTQIPDPRNQPGLSDWLLQVWRG